MISCSQLAVSTYNKGMSWWHCILPRKEGCFSEHGRTRKTNLSTNTTFLLIYTYETDHGLQPILKWRNQFVSDLCPPNVCKQSSLVLVVEETETKIGRYHLISSGRLKPLSFIPLSRTFRRGSWIKAAQVTCSPRLSWHHCSQIGALQMLNDQLLLHWRWTDSTL